MLGHPAAEVSVRAAARNFRPTGELVFASDVDDEPERSRGRGGHAHEAIKLGIEVYWPIAEGGRFDLIFAFEDASLARVQCNGRRSFAASSRSAPTAPAVPQTLCATADTPPKRSTRFAAYCPDNGHCYYVSIEKLDGQRTFHLRLGPAANNQAHGVNWALEYELGAIAQLGERVTGSHEVAGSSPASSIVRGPP